MFPSLSTLLSSPATPRHSALWGMRCCPFVCFEESVLDVLRGREDFCNIYFWCENITFEGTVGVRWRYVWMKDSVSTWLTKTPQIANWQWRPWKTEQSVWRFLLCLEKFGHSPLFKRCVCVPWLFLEIMVPYSVLFSISTAAGFFLVTYLFVLMVQLVRSSIETTINRWVRLIMRLTILMADGMSVI